MPFRLFNPDSTREWQRIVGLTACCLIFPLLCLTGMGVHARFPEVPDSTLVALAALISLLYYTRIVDVILRYRKLNTRQDRPLVPLWASTLVSLLLYGALTSLSLIFYVPYEQGQNSAMLSLLKLLFLGVLPLALPFIITLGFFLGMFFLQSPNKAASQQPG